MVPNSSLLSSPSPTNISPTKVTIGHVQLRDLIICPREAGVVNYVQGCFIVEHDLHAPDLAPRRIADLPFNPNTLASLELPGTDNILFAAGGQEAEIHLSLHQPSSRLQRRENSRLCNNGIWQYCKKLQGSINNSVLLSSLSLTRSAESSVEPRLVVSNNDCTVKFYDIAVRGESLPRDMQQSGGLKLEEPINHSSISPDGTTLLSVGDSPRIYLHHLTGGSYITFTPIVTLNVPPPDARFYSSTLSASFSTAFSSDGMKFAVASQEGVVAVWDVRSTKPIKVMQTDKTRLPVRRLGSGETNSLLSDDPWDWTRGNSKAPGWGARSVKFGAGGSDGRPGHEIMTFTEHTNLLHVIDARTFETEEIIRIPGVVGREASPSASSRATPISPMLSDPSPLSPVPSSFRQVIQPPRAMRALDDASRLNTFPSSGSLATRRPSRIILRRDGSDNGGYDYDEVIIIRGNAVEETREAFTRHGVRAHSQLPTRGGSGMYVYNGNDVEGDEREDADSMDVDEPETDCISRGPSRSSSPPPSLHLPLQPSPPPSRSIAFSRHSNIRNSSRPRRRTITRDGVVAEQTVQNSDRDIAGTCFDPHGGFIYVATTDSISEWAIRGAEKRWWGCNAWV